MAEAIVTMPDGRKAKITGPSKEAIIEQVRKMGGMPSEPASPMQAVTQNTAERLVGGLLGVPEFAARAGRGANNVMRAAMGHEMQPIPPEGLLGLPTGREAISSLEGLLSGQPSEGFVQRRNQIEQDQPFAALGGDVLGDAMTLMGGRAPFLKGKPMPAETANKAAGVMESVADSAIKAPARTDIIAGPLRRALNKTLNERAAQALSRMGGRSLEAGVEGAILSIAQGGDPLEMAAMSGASQMAGLAGLKAGEVAGFGDLLKGNFIKGGLKLGATAFAVGSLLQSGDSLMPGGADNLISDLETGYDKIPIALLLGGMAAMTGAGRVNGNLPIVKANMPAALADALTTIPRAATINILKEVFADDSRDLEKAIISIIATPQAFKKSDLEALNDSIEKGTFGETVRRLSEQDDFRAVIDAPHPGLAGVPIKK